MFTTPWICTRCLRSLTTVRNTSLPRRWQTTKSPTDNISPALLARAQSIAHEHASLTEKLANEFDAKDAKRIGELKATTSALQEYEKAHATLRELQTLLNSPDKELQQLAQDDLEPTQQQTQQASQALTASLVPVHPFAHLPCIIEIRPGAGGDEAALFAGDLLRMYQNLCAQLALRTNIIKLETAEASAAGGTAGGTSGVHVQEAILEVETPGSYGILRCEAGVHRVQRVPATESKGRTHTSAASVLVLPSMPNDGTGEDLDGSNFSDPKSDYYVDSKEVRVDVMRAGGAGGQHVNKTESAVRITHAPTGTVVTIQESRSQIRNREIAWRLLRSKLAQLRREEREEELRRMRRGAGAGKAGRENKVRTYNFGQQRVSDHRSGIDVRNLDEVMQGGLALERVMESVRTWMQEQEILDVVAEAEEKGG